jgi:7-cyano-7-deazaguanine tRNA-ribosyltransferase
VIWPNLFIPYWRLINVMPDSFEILHKDLAGRIGRFSTLHGTVETPALMPVVNPHLQVVPPPELSRMGAPMVITNSYIIHQDEGLRRSALEKGLHATLGFEKPIMTDSGAFQLSVYGSVEVQPLEILRFQQAIKSDICVPLDIPTPPDVPRDRAVQELKETERRLVEASENRDSNKSLLAGPIQGSIYLDLREQAGRFLRDKKFDLYPIGAVVPLMESYRYDDLVNVVAASKAGLGSGAPTHLFGAGHPMVFALAAALGCDLFDSAAYALYARDGRYLTARGTWKLREMNYLPCPCPICQGYTQKELMESPERLKLLAMHNLYASFAEINLIKQCIREGSLWDLLESRCRSHPRMLDGFHALGRHAIWLESLDTSTKSTFFYLSPESSARPEVLRYGEKIGRLKVEGKVLVTDQARKEDAQEFDAVLHFKPPFGPYPPDLSETYPLNAEVPKKPDVAAVKVAMQNAQTLREANPSADFTFRIRRAEGVQDD